MQTMRAAAVSMNGFLGEPLKVLSAIAGWCERAATEKAEFVLFPELVVHGHCTPNTWELAEPVPDGPTVKRLCQIARHFRLFISAGLSEKENDIVYNTQVLVGPDGYIGKQRKLHLSRDEVMFYKGGRDINVFDIGKCKVGTVICYDNQFPEIARVLALKGAELILMPHAARMKMWDETPESATKARRHTHDQFRAYALRARENACFVMIADQAGRAGYVDTYPRDSQHQPHHGGAAIIFDPEGELIMSTQADQIKDEMIITDLEAELLNKQRSLPNFTLRTRRPELFGELVKDQVSS
jgi:predicted amidohydrolase